MADIVFPPQISLLPLARATNLASYTVYSQFLKRWQEDATLSNPLITAALREYEARFETLDQNYKLAQKSDWTQQIRDEDEARDAALSQFSTVVRSLAKSSLKAYAEPASLLLAKFDLYAIDPKMQIDQENALIQNWAQEMASDACSAALDQLGLRPLFEELLSRTAKIAGLITSRTDDRANQSLSSVKSARVACDEAYRYLVFITNAVIATSPDPSVYAAFVQKVEGDIRYHKQNTLKG